MKHANLQINVTFYPKEGMNKYKGSVMGIKV